VGSSIGSVTVRAPVNLPRSRPKTSVKPAISVTTMMRPMTMTDGWVSQVHSYLPTEIHM
jgi:hypothetical protein